MAEIRDIVSEIVGCKFNFVLVNFYCNGYDKIGRHRDDEEGLDLSKPIASVSLGETRTMVMQHASVVQNHPFSRIETKYNIVLEHGSLLVMRYPTNVHWYHEIPIEKSRKLPRLNLTFRVLKEEKK